MSRTTGPGYCGLRHGMCYLYPRMKQDYICAIPLFGTRVAPRCMYSVTMLVAGVRGGGISFRRSVSTEEMDEYRWLELLLDLEIDIIVCGGISPHINKLLSDYGIKVISNVAGEAQEVLSALVREELHPWFGYYGANGDKKDTAPAGILSEPVGTAPESCGGFRGCKRWTDAQRSAEGVVGESLVAKTDFSVLGRVEEFGDIAHAEGYRLVGLVYCTELSGYAGQLSEQLGDKVEICMLACPARCSGGTAQGMGEDMPCKPVVQAESINSAGCDLVMLIGHCPAFQAVLKGHVNVHSAVLFPAGSESAASKSGLGG